MKIKIAPSVLAADFLHLEEELKRTEDAGADMLHCDIMDGIYVPNMSFGFGIIEQMHSATKLPLDVHMMTAKPQNYIDVLKKSGAASVTFHTDVMDEEGTVETLKKIRELGMKAAISVKPKQGADEAIKYAKYCDMILVMTVEPGFGGQKFMADMLPKIKAIREYIDANGLDCEIQVDGGIGRDTIAGCAAAGATNFVIGTASYRAPDMKAALDEYKALAEAAR